VTTELGNEAPKLSFRVATIGQGDSINENVFEAKDVSVFPETNMVPAVVLEEWQKIVDAILAWHLKLPAKFVKGKEGGS